MAVWPASLPTTLQVEGYQEEPPDTRLVTEMDAGPPKMRQRYTAAPRPLAGFITITRAQRVTLDAFFVTTLAGGALPFDWTHPVTGAAVVMRFGRSQGPLRYEALSTELFRAAMTLEIQP